MTAIKYDAPDLVPAVTVTTADRHCRGILVEPSVAVLFMSGIMLTIVGSGRAWAIVRFTRGVVADHRGGTQPLPLHERSDVATLMWLTVSLYGLFLATAGVLLGR